MTNKISKDAIYSLSIQVCLDGFSFFIQDTGSKKVEFFKNTKFKESISLQNLAQHIEDTFKNNELLTNEFHQVTVIYSNELFTIVPEALFDTSKATDYLKYNAKILSTDVIAYDEIKNGIVNVYVPYTNLNNYFFDRFGTFDYYHSITIFLQALHDQTTDSSSYETLVILSTTEMYLGITKNEKLELVNRFEIKTPEDFIYYLLFCFAQLNIDPEKVVTRLSGQIDMENPYYKIAHKYIRNIELIESPQKNIPKEHFLLATLL